MNKHSIKTQEQPLPKDKPASYGNEKSGNTKREKPTGNREDKGISKIKSDKDSPQKVREKLEYDHQKREKDPGMTKR